MKDWNVVKSHGSTHEPLIMRLYFSEDFDLGPYIELVDCRDKEPGKIRAYFMVYNNKMKVFEKAFCKESSCPLKSETGWAEDQAWNYLQEISHTIREIQEALVPNAR